jgi:hypothetical protein
MKVSKELQPISEGRDAGHASAVSPYCEVKWGKTSQRTGVRKHQEQPRWFERFHLCAPPHLRLSFHDRHTRHEHHTNTTLTRRRSSSHLQ